LKFLEEKYKLLFNEKRHACHDKAITDRLTSDDAFCNKNKYINNKCRAITNLRDELFLTNMHSLFSSLDTEARKRILRQDEFNELFTKLNIESKNRKL
jgi:hypothetical protein